MHGAPFALAVGKVEDQPFTCLGLGVAVQGDDLAVHCRDAPAHRTAGEEFVGDRDHVAREWDAPIEADLESDGTVFGVGEQRPLASALGLGFAGAADGANLQWIIAIAPLELCIGHSSDVCVVVVLRVVVADQRPGVPGALRCAGVGELPINDVRPGVGKVEVGCARHVRQGEHLALCPVSHAPVDCRDVTQQRPGVSLALQVQVADKARLLAALPVRYQLVAVLRDPVSLAVGVPSNSPSPTAISILAIATERRLSGASVGVLGLSEPPLAP